HLGERLVAQDAGVVDEDVDPAPRVDHGAHQGIDRGPVGDVVPVDDRLAAGRGDLVDDLLGGGGGAALAVHVAAEIVDDDPGATLGQCEGVGAAESAARSGDDRDAVGEIDCVGHGGS